ncbi:diaminopimelate epimerase [Flavihumibacter stibioxidans]|uniref:Diaminopimelate epimerase n=1 Tax=Flavihumibacter stibioxidans TaxID=1834163 RepID=A0ABR7MDK8_9BACT|nr:diaminopimelate epimerase [Flavihumibacter stibioxidans]MBC6493122.1 diaminopimelate epimerase [Flavihumibacter stibioxidans]
MELSFYKYQGTGNDFVILDNRDQRYNSLTNEEIHFLCNRRFGIGADGLMLLNAREGYDFEMKYFNSDGNESSMCGNGGRCLVKFAFHMGIVRTSYSFIATDGPHEAEIDERGDVRLKMQDVTEVKEHHGDEVMNTGSPHYVKTVQNLDTFDVFNKGREIRYSHAFQPGGLNVNFVEPRSEDEIMVRTYERGVEDETLSCGTGVTASAIANFHNEQGFNEVSVITRGGRLSVEFERNRDGSFTNVWLCGPAEKVFEGTILLPQ